MRAAGISVSKNLAVIVGLEWDTEHWYFSHPSPKLITLPKEMDYGRSFRIYTLSDGSAFPRCPYFKKWAATKELITHDVVESIDFERVVADFCAIYGCSAVGYSAEQHVKVLSGRLETYPIPTSWLHKMLEILNAEMSGYEGLFERESSMDYMWRNLPRDEHGRACLPHGDHTASGRWDGIRAFLNAMGACYKTVFDEEERRRQEKATEDALLAEFVAWLPDDELVCVQKFEREPPREVWASSGHSPECKCRPCSSVYTRPQPFKQTIIDNGLRTLPWREARELLDANKAELVQSKNLAELYKRWTNER